MVKNTKGKKERKPLEGESKGPTHNLLTNLRLIQSNSSEGPETIPLFPDYRLPPLAGT